MTIEYRIDGRTVARMTQGLESKDQAGIVAQKYMSQFKAIETAHILTEEVEIVIRRAHAFWN